jgi:hypothetical protein
MRAQKGTRGLPRLNFVDGIDGFADQKFPIERII